MTNSSFEPEKYLANSGIGQLNEMQLSALDAIAENKELILSAPTGTGKTLAFLLMMLKKYPGDHKDTFAMIVTPTRELALQITDVFQKMKTGLKITTCYGGHKREIEEQNLVESPAIIVGTPGRIGDHIRRENIKTETIEFLILDEFDKSLELGFTDEMKFILDSLPAVETKILVSATALKIIPDFIGLKEPVRLEFYAGDESKLKVSKVSYDEDQKMEKLFDLICTIGNRRTIIFANQKETVHQLLAFVSAKGIQAVSYHGSMEQQERETSITKFRNGSSLFLVTTDLASRGLDISNVRFIIHYDLPETKQVYIHRNGRSARMEASGDAILMTRIDKTLPDYLSNNIEEFSLLSGQPVPDKTEWSTLFLSAGKKDKVNKIDILGFLTKHAGLKREDTGLIEVKDFYSFAAIRRSKMNYLLGLGNEQRIKNKKVRVAPAR